jgi:predicted PurR-regulated permease PerM
MMLVALFFLLVDGPRLGGWLREVSPLGSRLTGELIEEVGRTTSTVLTSTVVSAAVQAAVAALGFALARVPAPLVFGALTFFAAFVPGLGSALVGVPAAAVLLLTGHIVGAAFLLGWTLLITGTVDQFVKPLVARGGTGLSGAVLFFSMLGGALAFGGLGLIIGPTAVTLVIALARVAQERLAAPSEEEPRVPPPGEPEHEPLPPH